jgi:DNA-binding transcriptional LysR family regulator
MDAQPQSGPAPGARSRGGDRRLHHSREAVEPFPIGDRFGVRLLDRLGKKAFATAAGREVIEHARRIATEADAVSVAMRRHREGFLGRVRLGSGPNILAYLLLPVLKLLRETHPNLEVAIRTGTTRDLAALGARNELDLAIVTLPLDDKRLAVTPLRSEPLLAVFSDAERDLPAEVTPAEIGRRTLVLDGRSQMDRMIRAWLLAGGVEPRPAMELGNPEALRSVVAAGLGVTILPPEVIASVPGLVVRPLRPRLVRDSAIIRRRDKPDDPALRIVHEAIVSTLRHSQQPPAAPAARSRSKRRR